MIRPGEKPWMNRAIRQAIRKRDRLLRPILSLII